VQGRDATAQLGEQLQKVGIESPIVILASGSASRLLAATWQATLPAAGYQYSVVKFNGECCASEIERLAEEGRRAGAKAIVGCGGGKVLDTAKASADLLQLPVACCPTVASSDAPCSALSVVYTPDGVVDHIRYYKRHPNLILVDTSVIAAAPKRLLVAGIGDALATYFEVRSALSHPARARILLAACCFACEHQRLACTSLPRLQAALHWLHPAVHQPPAL
jgi:glycerol dehydrogenase